MSDNERPTIVLVHGAWADGSSWSRAVAPLQNEGFSVQVAPNPLRGIAADSQYLSDYLSTFDVPIVLVGHSYGGVVISNAATRTRNVRALVYVDAFLPDEGETLAQLAGAVPGSVLAPAIADPTTVFTLRPFPGAPEGVFDSYVRPEVFVSGFAADLSREEANVLAAAQMPLATSAVGEASGAPAWRTLPSWVLIGTNDSVIPAAGQAFMAERADAQVDEVNAAHLSMMSHPDEVVALVRKAASSVA
jgi:pimeloyl-ACP methyl ester carboxylesterase